MELFLVPFTARQYIKVSLSEFISESSLACRKEAEAICRGERLVQPS